MFRVISQQTLKMSLSHEAKEELREVVEFCANLKNLFRLELIPKVSGC
jgi:hypothetical protein